MKYDFPSTRYHRSNFYFMKYDFPFPRYQKSAFYLTKYDFPFTRYHRSNFYFVKYDFPSTRYHKSNFYFMKYDFPSTRYHRSNFYFMKNLLEETSPSKKLSGPNFSCFRSQNCRFWSQSAGKKILSKVIFSLNLGILFDLGKIWHMRR
jgi:hypothetical protein